MLEETKLQNKSTESEKLEMPKTDFSFNFKAIEDELDGIKQILIDSRDLHEQLQVKTKYTDWIQRRIESTGFKKDKHYKVFLTSGKNPQGGRPTEKYLISYRMAQHLAQMESTDIGFKVRDYFIDCEDRLQKAVNEQKAPRKPRTPKAKIEVNPALRKQARIAYRQHKLSLKGIYLNADQLCLEADNKKQGRDVRPTRAVNNLFQ